MSLKNLKSDLVKNLRKMFENILPAKITEEDKELQFSANDDLNTDIGENERALSHTGSVSEGASVQNIPNRKVKAGLTSNQYSLTNFTEFLQTNQYNEAIEILKMDPTYIETVFFEACLENNPARCRDLLDQKKFGRFAINPNCKNSSGSAGLHIAAKEGFLVICEVLLNYGIDFDINIKDSDGKTPLHLACIHNELEIAKVLLRAGAFVEVEDNIGNTPLDYAISKSNHLIVEWLLNRHPDQNFINTELNILQERSPKSPKSPFRVCINSVKSLVSDDDPSVNIPKEMNYFGMIQEINNFFITPYSGLRLSPEDFEPIKLLGKGSFGEVYLVEKTNTNLLFAMKILAKNKMIAEHLVKYAITERNIMSSIKNPFIVSLRYSFQTSNKLYLIEDYCSGGTLKNMLQKDLKFSESLSRLYICEVLSALTELHRNDIIYRDLKPENVVIDSQGHALLTDFGLSKEDVLEKDSAHSFCGSVSYLAPEMLKRRGHGKAVD